MKSIPLFLIPLIVGFAIQVIKLGIDILRGKAHGISALWGAGGFPSVHSGIVSSLCTLVYLHQGYDSLLFAMCISFSFLFRYDAANVRYEAGQHASLLNKLNKKLHTTEQTTEHPDKPQSPHHFLKERLGHTVYEVVGGIFMGCILTFLYFLVLS